MFDSNCGQGFRSGRHSSNQNRMQSCFCSPVWRALVGELTLKFSLRTKEFSSSVSAAIRHKCAMPSNRLWHAFFLYCAPIQVWQSRMGFGASATVCDTIRMKRTAWHKESSLRIL